MKVLRNIFIIMAAALLVTAACAAAYYFSVTADADLNAEKLYGSENYASVYDISGEKAAEVSFFNADKKVKVADLPPYVKHAFIATEDKKFYSHHGLDYARILKAAAKNISSRSFRQGASTISQQLIKNTHLTNEKTIRRKLREVKLTRMLEKQYKKDEILEMYLNTIYFGHGCYGIAGAADYYFSHPAEELTLSDSAMLAAIIRSPNNYSPFVNPQKCLAARNSVLKKMFEQGYIAQSAYEGALADPLPERRASGVSVRSYLRGVLEELEGLSVFSPYMFLSGAKIYTYLDTSLQKYIENLSTDADRSGKSIVIEDNKTAGIAAFYTSEGNIARQPGSLMKPLAVYAPAIEECLISACTPIADEKTDFEGYSPSNYKGIYRGYISARQALSESVNVPAVRVLNALGIERSEEYLAKMGLRLRNEDKTLSLALGGMSEGYTLRELVGAYALFAAEGVYTPPAFISKIEDADGIVIYERSMQKRRVFSDDTAYIVNDILKDAARTGTAKKLASLKFDLCAKTGTCGTESGNTDAYTVCYTSAHTVGVWMGNADNTKTDITGGGLPCHYAMLIAKNLYADSAPAPLPVSEHVCRAAIDKIAYDKYHEVLLAPPEQPKKYTFTEIFRKTALPEKTGTSFSFPKTEASLSFDGKAVTIDLCQAEYFDILIKRQNKGSTEKIYEGKAKQVKDENINANEKYIYTLTPYYTDDTGKKIYGTEIRLPEIYTKKRADKPNETQYGNWWETFAATDKPQLFV